MSFIKVVEAIITLAEREKDLCPACNEAISVKILIKGRVKHTINMNETAYGCSAIIVHNILQTQWHISGCRINWAITNFICVVTKDLYDGWYCGHNSNCLPLLIGLWIIAVLIHCNPPRQFLWSVRAQVICGLLCLPSF